MLMTPGGKALLNASKRGWNSSSPKARRLENHGVSHDQGRNQRREGLVQRIVIRPHAKHHAKRRAPDLADGALDDLKARIVVVEAAQGFDGGAHIVDGAVEFLLGIGQALGDFPHEQPHDLGAAGHHLPDEVLHAGNAVGDLHGRPDAAAAVIGLDGRGQRRIGFFDTALGNAAELGGFQRTVAMAQMDGRDHLLALALPHHEFAIDQHGVLMDLRRNAVFGGDILRARKQLFERD